MTKQYLLSFLIFFNSSFAFAISDNEVIQKYKQNNEAYKYDLYWHVKDSSNSESKDWAEFENYIQTAETYQKKAGVAYMISGAAVAIAASFGFSNADSSTERIAYAFAQSLGIGAIGYGTYKYYIGNNDRSFYHVVNNTSGLSVENKNALILNYDTEKKWQKQRINWIAIGTYSLIALANYINASRQEDQSTRDALYVIGGVYTLAAISVSF
jgi:hypothetical protein